MRFLKRRLYETPSAAYSRAVETNQCTPGTVPETDIRRLKQELDRATLIEKQEYDVLTKAQDAAKKGR